MDWKFRITWVKASRLPRLPLWAAGVVAFWALLLALLHWLELRSGAIAETCPFHRITGRRCVTCGSTRALFALMHGHFGQALRLNPLVTTAMVVMVALFLFRLATGRRPSIEVGKNTQQAAWALAICLLLGNWVWVLRTLG